MPPAGGSFDVVVAGGGPAGAAAAVALARAGLTVAVLERSGHAAGRVGEVLPPEIRPVLSRLGAWERFLACGPTPSPGTLSAWGAAEPRSNDFVFNPHGDGWHVDRRAFDEMLARCAEEAGAAVHRAARPVLATRAGGGWDVEAEVGGARRRFRSRFVVDATGRSAWLASRHGRRVACDRLVGVLGYLPHAPVEDPRLLVEATETGWWYSAVAPGAGLVAAYMTDRDLLPRAAQDPTTWSARLAEAPLTARRVHDAGGPPRPRVVRAETSAVDPPVGDGWLAVGDAAAAFDPLWGRGVCHALESGRSGALAILASLGGDPAGLGGHAERESGGVRAFLRERTAQYRLESRWPAAPFWRRRHGGTAGPPHPTRGRSDP